VKILQVTPFFSPVHGGSAEVPYQLTRELARRNHSLTIHTSDSKLSREYIDPLPEVKVHAFKTWAELAKFYITPGMIGKARKEVKDFDVVHLHNYRTFQNIVVHRYAKEYNIPYVLQAHGTLTTYFQKGTLKRAFDTLWGYKLLKDAAKVIAVTKTEAEQYQSMRVSEDKIEIVPHAVNLAEFVDLPDKGEFKKKYDLGDDQRIVLYLGRIHKIKGLDLLAGAFADLCRLREDVRLVISGPDDGYLSSLMKLIADLEIGDRVISTGPLYGREKLKAYVDADVYVLPSWYEIFGITILEACACGTPVIVTSSCGLADWVESYQAGYVVLRDKNRLQQALVTILTDEKLRQKLANQARRLVTEQFTWDKIAVLLENLYYRIAVKPPITT